MSNLCWPNSAPQLPQFMGHPILVLRKQTCACPASGMSTRLTTPFIPGQISSRHISSRTDLFVCMVAWWWLRIPVGTPGTCLEKANLGVPGERDEHEVDNTFHPRTNFIPRNFSSRTDLFFYLYGCVMVIEDTCWNTQYLYWESKLVHARRAEWAQGWQHLSSQDIFHPNTFHPELICLFVYMVA